MINDEMVEEHPNSSIAFGGQSKYMNFTDDVNSKQFDCQDTHLCMSFLDFEQNTTAFFPQVSNSTYFRASDQQNGLQGGFNNNNNDQTFAAAASGSDPGYTDRQDGNPQGRQSIMTYKPTDKLAEIKERCFARLN